MELQFAFGSNMHPDRLREKQLECIEKILATARRARLYDWKFGFTKKAGDGSGKANIIQSDGDIVWGLLIELNPKNVRKMDDSEGVPRHYVRTEDTTYHPLRVITDDEEAHECIAYIADTKKVELNGIPPTTQYLDYIVEGAIAHDIPSDYIDRIRNTPTFD